MWSQILREIILISWKMRNLNRIRYVQIIIHVQLYKIFAYTVTEDLLTSGRKYLQKNRMP